MTDIQSTSNARSISAAGAGFAAMSARRLLALGGIGLILALMLAIVQPWVALSEGTRKKVAWTFLIGSWLLPVGVFLIHYVGLAYSPLEAIGWASICADFGGTLVVAATLLYLLGIARHLR